MPAPVLIGEAALAVEHRGSHLQIVAAAGSGKTEVVSQRVAGLLAEGVPASGIVAFTFTERAATELRHRITERVAERLGVQALDQLGSLFVGTIHAYCFRMLQTHVPRFETYDVVDDNQLNALLAREANRLTIKELTGAMFSSIREFLTGAGIVENELLDPEELPDPFGRIYRDHLDMLERYRLLTYGQQIVRAVGELGKLEVAAAVHGQMMHLIVDEYQDVNPAQERLIQLMTGPQTQLCVVGDDDQAIYAWRGSDVTNIIDFAKRCPSVATFSITTNRRSRPDIIAAANTFAETIPGRLAKEMNPARPAGGAAEIAAWAADLEQDEAGYIANMILDLHDDRGVAYRDIAILVRGRASYKRLVEQLASFDIPVQPGGRTGLFDTPEGLVLGRTLVWLAGYDWRFGFAPATTIEKQDLLAEYTAAFGFAPGIRGELSKALDQWAAVAKASDHKADLIQEYYALLDLLDVREWDLSDPMQSNRMGTLARMSALLADFESVRRRARADVEQPGEQVGGEWGGVWYYCGLATHILNYAGGAYEGFDGEEDNALDAVDILTVHRAKGLEWPVVFVPSMTSKRFPSSRTGRVQDWPLPRELFPAARYEGGDHEERRLFYVAMTRARDWLSLSRHDAVTKNRTAASPYWQEVAATYTADPDAIDYPMIESASSGGDADLEITFSALSSYLECGAAYRLRTLLGFQPRLAPELGYGKAVHHVLRAVSEATKATGVVPSALQIEQIIDVSFFLPAANKPAHKQLKEAARRLVTQYAEESAGDLLRVWETERPFELHLPGVVVSGRADVILDYEEGVATRLAILDYKTSTDADDDHGLQLQVYADAGRREGLDVRAAYVHDLKGGKRMAIDVEEGAVARAEAVVVEAAGRLRDRDFAPRPGPGCRTCEVRQMCSAAF